MEERAVKTHSGRYGAASFIRLHVAWYFKGVVSVEPGAIRACVER